MAFGDFGRSGGHVRGDEDVGELPQGVRGGEWFDLAHIEGGTGEVARLKGGCEIGEVNDNAATDVDEVAAGTHAGEGCGSKELLRTWGMWSGDDHEVALLEQGIELVEWGDRADVLDGAQDRVDAEDVHAERFGTSTDLFPDGPDSDDAQSAIGEMEMGSIDGSRLAGTDGKIGE